MEGHSATSDLAARRATLEGACAALAGLDEVLYQAGGDQLGPLLTLLDRLGMAAELGRVHVTAEAIARGETGTRGSAATPAQWVRAHAPSTLAGGAAQIVTLARELAKTANAPVLAAVTDGHLPLRSAAAVIDEADRLRPLLADGAEPAVLAGLITMAAEHGPRGVRMVRPRLLAQYGLDDQLQREQDAAAGFVALSQPRPAGSGIYEYLLTLDSEGHAVLESALGPLSAPRPTDGAPDHRSSDRRRGDALVQLVRRAVAAGDSVPTTTKAQLFITMDYHQLAARLSSADSANTSDSADARRPPGLAAGTVLGGPHAGELLAPETIRRIACDAALVPVVLGTNREILDWGRARRLFTPAQTASLWLRDGGCTYPGCDAPAHWCDAHHLIHWADGGPSDLLNAALLCAHHHQLVHRRRLAGNLADSGSSPPGATTPGATTATYDRVHWNLHPGSYDRLITRRAAGDAA
jgi:hypothetical protein